MRAANSPRPTLRHPLPDEFSSSIERKGGNNFRNQSLELLVCTIGHISMAAPRLLKQLPVGTVLGFAYVQTELIETVSDLTLHRGTYGTGAHSLPVW